MHAVFMPYGVKNMVDLFLEHLNHKLLPLKMWKEGAEDKSILIQCQIRVLPFGFIEFVFPREYKDEVLTALGFHNKGEYKDRLNKSIMGIKPMNMIRKVLKIEPIPKFELKAGFPIMTLPISIFPVGIREDGDIVEPEGRPYAGYTHEAI